MPPRISIPATTYTGVLVKNGATLLKGDNTTFGKNINNADTANKTIPITSLKLTMEFSCNQS